MRNNKNNELAQKNKTLDENSKKILEAGRYKLLILKEMIKKLEKNENNA